MKATSQRFPKKHHQKINGKPLWKWTERYCEKHKLSFNVITDDRKIAPHSWKDLDYANDDFINTCAKYATDSEWTVWMNPCAPFRRDDMHITLENRVGKNDDLGLFVRKPTIQPMSLIRGGTVPFIVPPGNTQDNSDVFQIDFSMVFFRTSTIKKLNDVPLSVKWTILSARRAEAMNHGVYVDIDTEDDFALARSHARTFFRSQKWSTESASPSTK